jgi:hypothetical protein
MCALEMCVGPQKSCYGQLILMPKYVFECDVRQPASIRRARDSHDYGRNLDACAHVPLGGLVSQSALVFCLDSSIFVLVSAVFIV